jgi:hypothetical protein
VACPLLEGIDLSGARGVLVLIAASKQTFKLSESRNAMNTIRRYAADDAHVIFGTAYDESLGDQLRVTVIATGLSSARKAQITPPLTVVQQPQQQGLRTGTDNLPILNQVAQAGPTGDGAAAATQLRRPEHPQRVAQRTQPGGGQGGCAVEQRHGRDRDPGVPEEAGRLRT